MLAPVLVVGFTVYMTTTHKKKTAKRPESPYPAECPVCMAKDCAPLSGWHRMLTEQFVEQAQQVEGSSRDGLLAMLDNPGYGTHEVEKAIDELREAARVLGEQEARAKLVNAMPT